MTDLLPDVPDDESARIAKKCADDGLDALDEREREIWTRLKAVSIAEAREKPPTAEEIDALPEWISDETRRELRRLVGLEDADDA